MDNKFFRITDDLSIKNRWFLGEIENDPDDDPWKYSLPERIVNFPSSLVIRKTSKGEPLDFTFAEFDVPIVSERLAQLFHEDEVQLVPITVEGEDSKYYILIVPDEIDCVDETKSDFEKWEPGNLIRPDKAGEYNAFFKLVIDPQRTESKRIFRLKKFDIAIIADSSIKDDFETSKLLGVEFEPVS